MADDIKEVKFSNDFYDANGNVDGSYSGDILVDFTTLSVLSGDFLGGDAEEANASISYSKDSNQYTISGSRKSGSIEYTQSSETFTFTGKNPSFLDSASLSVESRTLEQHGQYKYDNYTLDTDGTTDSQRAVTVQGVAPSIAFNPTTSGFQNGVTPKLSGTVSAPANGLASVEIYNGDQDLGAATVSSNGTWTFKTDLGSGDYADLTAVATAGSGATASATAPYELVTGISGEPYRALEYDAAPDDNFSYTEYSSVGKSLVVATYNGDGTHTITTSTNGQDLYSAYNDTMTGAGNNETFVFLPSFGQDEVTDFTVAGAGHDYLDLSGTQFHTLAQALNHTTMSGGNATIHVDKQDTVTLDGVTKAQLKAHPGDFLFA